MSAKKLLGSPEIESDDAPELLADMLERAEVFNGDKFVRRGRGRPPLDAPKEKINVRVDRAVLDRLRASGPGWQTRVNNGMAMMTGVDRWMWDWIDLRIAEIEREIEHLKRVVERMEVGTMRSFTNDEDTTEQSLAQNRDGVEQRMNAITDMRKLRMKWMGSSFVDDRGCEKASVDPPTPKA